MSSGTWLSSIVRSTPSGLAGNALVHVNVKSIMDHHVHGKRRSAVFSDQGMGSNQGVGRAGGQVCAGDLKKRWKAVRGRHAGGVRMRAGKGTR